MATSTTLRRQRPDLETGEVISLRRPQLDTEIAPGYPDLDSIVRAWTRSGLIGDMKHAIEASVFEVLARHLVSGQRTDEGPFDSIYLADLTSDPIAANDTAALLQHANITDLSNELVLKDGWDD